MLQKQLWLLPGEKLSLDFKEQLKKCNKNRSEPFTRASNDKYIQELCAIFGIAPETLPQLDRDYKLILAGFIVGEGSFNISAKKTPDAKFGVVIAPEFSITQHVNGISYLLGAVNLFGDGRIAPKGNSNATIVFRIGGVEPIKKNVVTFWKDYIRPTQSSQLREEREKFFKVLDLLSAKPNVDTLVDEILPLWDSLRKQKGQSNQAFTNLLSAQKFVRDHVANKSKT